MPERTPDPNHGWVRFAPRAWPGAAGLWLDLFTRNLGRPGDSGSNLDAELLAEPRDDVVYLPPVDEALEESRQQVIRTLEIADTPLIVQGLPSRVPTNPGPKYVYDLLQATATRSFEALQNLPPGSSAVWPLITGYTDDLALWNEVLAGLAESGISRVQGICADLAPADRRRIVEVAGEQGFDKLFHGSPPSEREFAAMVHRFGLEPFLGRPLPEAPARLRGNRALAADLALIGELWLRLGRSESRGQSFYRASRWIDLEVHDLTALAREGNLGVVTWLDAPSSEVVQEIVATGDSLLLAALRQEYLEPPLGGS